MPNYPAQIDTFRLTGLFGNGVGDTTDAGDAPDLNPLSGMQILCVPNIDPTGKLGPVYKVPTASEPVTIYQNPIYGVTDGSGRIVTASAKFEPVLNGSAGIVLPWGGSTGIQPSGWTWTITITVPGSNFPPKVFSIFGAPGATYNVTSSIEVPANPGTDVANWQAVVNQVLIARDQAVAAADGSSGTDTGGGTIIDDSTPSTLATYSSQKVSDLLNVKLSTGVQALTAGQIAQVKTNLGIVDFVAPARIGEMPMAIPGKLVAGVGQAPWPIGIARTLKGVTLGLGTAASGDTVVDVNKNGVSIFTDATTRPRVVAGRKIATRQTINNVSLASGDTLTVDLDSVGSSVARSYVGFNTSTTSGQVVTIARPTAAAAGDMHVATVIATVGGAVGATGQPATAITPPPGWVESGPGVLQAHNSSARDFEVHTFTWRDDGSQTSFAFTVTTPTGVSSASGILSTYRGASGADTYAGSAALVGTSTPSAPSVTTTGPNGILVCSWMNLNGSTAVPTLPAGFTFVNGGTGRTLMAYKFLTDAGDTGPTTLTGADASTQTHWVGTSQALKTDQTGASGADLTLILDYVL